MELKFEASLVATLLMYISIFHHKLNCSPFNLIVYGVQPKKVKPFLVRIFRRKKFLISRPDLSDLACTVKIPEIILS